MRILGLAAVVVMGCGSGGTESVCVTCPIINGSYMLTWTDGLAASDCPSMGPRPGIITIKQDGSTLTSKVGTTDLTGNLYGSYDFDLSGGFDPKYRFRGTAIVGSTDGGTDVQLRGKLTTQGAVDGGAVCFLDEPYVADHL